MLVSSKHNHSQLYSKHSNIPFHDSCIEVVTCNTLSWDEHINNLIKRCNKYLYLLSRIKCYLSVSSRKLFYNAYIMPQFDYCCVICGNCSAYLEDELTQFQKRAARLILNRYFNTHSAFLFSEFKWISFPDRVIYQNVTMRSSTSHRFYK